MPSALLTMVGGDIRLPITVFESATLSMKGGAIAGGEVSVGLSKGNLRLDRLTRMDEITAGNSVNQRFQTFWQNHCEAIENADSRQNAQIDTLTEIVAALEVAQNAARQATEIANAAQSDVALSTSSLSPLAVLTADSSGTITIASHSRVYSDKTVSVDGDTIVGLTNGVFYRVYYNDIGREGGAVSYLTTESDLTQTNGVHVVGGATIPLVGAPPSSGSTITPPGYVAPELEGITP